MKIEEALKKRSDNKCELCNATTNLSSYKIPPTPQGTLNDTIYICSNCYLQIEQPEKTNPNHWHCLKESMWSETTAVQVVAWRMLHRLKNEGWTQNLLDMLYLDDETLKWAKSTGENLEEEDKIIHKDSNGIELQAGDTVVLIKDLNVKGANFTAKRGTAVRNISLVHDNAAHIEGKVEGQQIVILTQFVKKS